MGVRSKVFAGMGLLGIEPWKFWHHLVNAPRFIGELRSYRKQLPPDLARFDVKLKNLRPLVLDYAAEAGEAQGQYFHQDLWAARKIHAARPARHVDIGSRIDGFIAHLLCFMPVEVIDIRPLTSDVEGLKFIQADATDLAALPDQSVESLSSLHAVEHFGLGRYSDPVEPRACFRAMRSIQRVLKPGGRLYFSVPVGAERVEFNAHRVFAPQTILDQFAELRLISFAAVNELGQFLPGVRPQDMASARYGCGLFEFARD